MSFETLPSSSLFPWFAVSAFLSVTAGAPGALAETSESSVLTVHCGDVSILLREQSQWTPGRIDFRDKPLTTERSAYGTVFLYPDVGFIGTGHLENEPEDLQSLRFRVDGKVVESPFESTESVEAKESFVFERESRIRDLSLSNVIEIRDDRLYETAVVSAGRETPLKLVYHFMHAWKPTVSAYLAGTSAGEVVASGSLNDEEEQARKFFINKPVDWIAVYDPETGYFAVSFLLESPPEAGHQSMIWNVPGTYRKYYLSSFQNQTVPADFTGQWRMVTAFGEVDSGAFEEAARELAARLAVEEAPRPERAKP